MNGLSLLRFVFFLRNTHQASDLTMAMTMLTTFSCCWFCTFFPCCNVVCQNLQCCVSKFAIFYPLVNTVIAVNGQWQQNNEGINDDRFTEVLRLMIVTVILTVMIQTTMMTLLPMRLLTLALAWTICRG